MRERGGNLIGRRARARPPPTNTEFTMSSERKPFLVLVLSGIFVVAGAGDSAWAGGGPEDPGAIGVYPYRKRHVDGDLHAEDDGIDDRQNHLYS